MTIVNTNIAETINIGQNGTYDVARYTTANVNVSSVLTVQKAKDANGKVVSGNSVIDLDGATDVGDYQLAYAYYGNTNITGALDLSSLTSISGAGACQNMFQNCTGITSVDLSNLTTISGYYGCGYMFQGCTGITSINLSSLTTISGSAGCNSMFYSCTGITGAVDLSSLTTISGSADSMFSSCTGITSIDLSSLTSLSRQAACQNMFSGCTSLATVYIGGTTEIDFGTYTNQFNNMFRMCSQNIDVYAPAASQAKIESFSGYPKFGAYGTVTWHWNTATE